MDREKSKNKELRAVELAAEIVILGCILLLGPSFTSADTDPNDVAALLDLYRNLSCPPQLTNWKPNGGDACEENWKGITCSGSRVTAINLAGNGFSGCLPYSISQMTSLKYINVSHNKFQGQLRDMFASLTSLFILDISFNAMSGDLPKSFNLCSSLTLMYLQNNQFTGTIDVLANLPLKYLNIENNHFSGKIPDRLKGINLQIGGTSGPAPGASRPSGFGIGGILATVIFLSVVGAMIAFFIMKRRSRKPSTEIENYPVFPLASHEEQEMKSIQSSSTTRLLPPPIHDQKSVDEDDASGII
ncbi:unnamed protein product [Coffea canephora]|uniref:Leucine-rich repeat-containing N-terminal plant-type domain-containing protein n=1 Tax=Coffea canephora TaxID=49390 RepID=A0A068UUS5_COFCA|nr:unnamed protein product [Coffea canephora]